MPGKYAATAKTEAQRRRFEENTRQRLDFYEAVRYGLAQTVRKAPPETEVRKMDFKLMLTTFGMIFLAELGDKTQLATLTFSAGSDSRLSVFLGSAGALVLTSLLAVLFGSFISRLVPPHHIRIGAGVMFIFLGAWMLVFSGGK